MRWLFGQRAPSLSFGDKEEVRRYLTEELKLAAFKDRETANFYAPHALGESMVPGLLRFQAAVDELVTRHSAIAPPPIKHAVENHRAWKVADEAYKRWVSRVAVALRAGKEPDPSWIEEAASKALAAARHTESLHGLLGSTPEDIAEMGMQALQSLDANPWSP